GSVVAAGTVLGLEQYRGELPAASRDLRAEDLARGGLCLSGLPQALVDHPELVARVETGSDVDVPAEDVDHLGGDAWRHPGHHGVLAQATLDPSGRALHLHEVGQRLAISGHGVAVAAALEHEQRAAVDLVAHRLELAGVPGALAGEPRPRLHPP